MGGFSELYQTLFRTCVIIGVIAQGVLGVLITTPARRVTGIGS